MHSSLDIKSKLGNYNVMLTKCLQNTIRMEIYLKVVIISGLDCMSGLTECQG